MFKGSNKILVTPRTLMEAFEDTFNRQAFKDMQIKVTGISSLASGLFEIMIEPRASQPTAKDKATADAAEDQANPGARRKQ